MHRTESGTWSLQKTRSLQPAALSISRTPRRIQATGTRGGQPNTTVRLVQRERRQRLKRPRKWSCDAASILNFDVAANLRNPAIFPRTRSSLANTLIVGFL